MQKLLLTIAIAFPAIAQAGCTSIAEIQTSNLYLEISDRGCGPLNIYFTRSISHTGTPVESTVKAYPFARECQAKWRSGEVAEFACQANGQTPLAGATYRRKKIGTRTDSCAGADEVSKPTEVDAYAYWCVKGCNNATPLILDEMTSCD